MNLMPELPAKSPDHVPLNAERNALHLNDGPIDLIIQAWGDVREVEKAYEAAGIRFETILGELVGELALLRTPVEQIAQLEGATARRMLSATKPFSNLFITPMAAVAGAVADEMLAAIRASATLDKIYVNNGGDIALWVAPGERLDIGLIDDLARAYQTPSSGSAGSIAIDAQSSIGGIATSGWRGRSFSLGIADAVTVLAKTAAQADAAASLIANAVNLVSNQIERKRAYDLDPDSDLGDQFVTIGVGPLSQQEVDEALASGAARAYAFANNNLIEAAALSLGGEIKIVNRPGHNLLVSSSTNA